ncbi:MAG: lytic transglycosylase domain-containing protein, partial [Pseudomonadota bacterium]
MRRTRLISGLIGLGLASGALAADTWRLAPPVPLPRPGPAAEAYLKRTSWPVARICDTIKAAAAQHGVPRDFFTRLIWKESRFDIKAVSPVGAQGIAQFMPATAEIRGLANPFDPAQAIPASAAFLADLKAQFGNWGLAAAAYNGGPERVSRFVARRGGLPLETRDYVASITYRPATWFREPGREIEPRPLDKELDFDAACRQIPIVKTRSILSVAARAPWGVQVAAGITRRAAQRGYQRVQARYRRVLGNKSASVYRVRVGGIRRYVARVGAPSRRAAQTLCAQIK